MKTKRILACVLAACTMAGALSLQGITFATNSNSAKGDNGTIRDSMTAQQYADDMGLGINLGNTMEAYNATNCESSSYKWPPVVGNNTPQDYEKYWGAVETTQEVIDGMKEAGFRTVRIPVFWGNMMKNDGTFTISGDYIKRVKEIVDYCRNDGLYAVINIHHFDEFIIRRNSKEDCEKIFKNLWTQIADYFKDYSDYLIFEGYNEYLGGGPIVDNEIVNLPENEGFDWTNTLNQAFVDAVRATGGNNANRMLIASGYWTNIDLTTKSDFKMPTDTADDRLMVSVHYVDNSKYWENKIGSKEWETYSIDQCNRLKKAFTDKGIPVFIGETTSVYPRSNFGKLEVVETSSEALDYMLRLITGYDFVPVLWDTNNNFYSRTKYKIKSSTDEAVIKKLAEELNQKLPQPPTKPTSSSNPPNPTPPSNPPTKTIMKSTTGSKIPSKTSKLTTALRQHKEKKVVKKAMKKAKIIKLKSNSRRKFNVTWKRIINVSWKKVKKAKGYQVQVSTNKKFKKSKILLTKSLKKTKITIINKKIKSNKTYYVRVRAYATYKTTNNKIVKVFSKWNKKLCKVTVK